MAKLFDFLTSFNPISSENKQTNCYMEWFRV